MAFALWNPEGASSDAIHGLLCEYVEERTIIPRRKLILDLLLFFFLHSCLASLSVQCRWLWKRAEQAKPCCSHVLQYPRCMSQTKRIDLTTLVHNLLFLQPSFDATTEIVVFDGVFQARMWKWNQILPTHYILSNFVKMDSEEKSQCGDSQ